MVMSFALYKTNKKEMRMGSIVSSREASSIFADKKLHFPHDYYSVRKRKRGKIIKKNRQISLMDSFSFIDEESR